VVGERLQRRRHYDVPSSPLPPSISWRGGGPVATPILLGYTDKVADCGKVECAIINQQVEKITHHHTSAYIFLGHAADKCRWRTSRPLVSPAGGLPVIDQQQD